MTPKKSPEWDSETDVIVVGLGGAGACAAIEASQNSSQVTVLERFTGGGATAISGGVIYAGGGTDIQKEAGVEDDIDSMHAYLTLETEGVVSPELILDFCRTSSENIRWLTSLGLRFGSSLCPYKTSYPNDNYYLYYSGNETIEPYKTAARPAPRGHRVKGKGLPGKNFFEPLRDQLRAQGVDVRLHSRVKELVLDEAGSVSGLVYHEIPTGLWSILHGKIEKTASKFALLLPPVARFFRRLGNQIEGRHANPKRIRARKGVILSTGGFINNRSMMSEFAPRYLKGLPIGTTGCSGEGMEMAQAVGGHLKYMTNISGWMFINPPHAFIHGMLVNREGRRFMNETLYGAVVGGKIMEECQGEAFLIIDQKLKSLGRSQIGRKQTQSFQTIPSLLNLRFNCKKAMSIEELAHICHCEADALAKSLRTYNDGAESGQPDEFKKEERATLQPPYYVIKCSDQQWTSPLMTLTLGGLSVDEENGKVLREDKSPIKGLYSAGRTAVGLCSKNYVSGLSIADCVYSGRRAGRAASNQPVDSTND